MSGRADGFGAGISCGCAMRYRLKPTAARRMILKLPPLNT